jgi:anthranilate synthase/aminodeoxychorismate synthase-like glutamine amidotransferase
MLLVDNYDSFTYNVMHLFGGLGVTVDVVRNDDAALTESSVAEYDCIVIGPGPGRPAAAGRTFAVIAQAVAAQRPLLGICLGQQAIAEYFGGVVTYAPSLMHGKTSEITHDASGVFARLPSPFLAVRYHSLCVAHEGFPAVLRVNASSEDAVIQGMEHRSLPVYGVQFHPESVLTTQGRIIAENFLALAASRGKP